MKEQQERRIKIEGVGAEPIREMLLFINGGMPDFKQIDVPILGDVLRLSHMWVKIVFPDLRSQSHIGSGHGSLEGCGGGNI